MFEKIYTKFIESTLKKIDLKSLILKIYEDKKDELFAALREIIENKKEELLEKLKELIEALLEKALKNNDNAGNQQ